MQRHDEENGRERPAAMNRREFVVSGVVTGALAVAGSAIPRRAGAASAGVVPQPGPWTVPDDFPLAEITIDRLQQAMQSGQYTARAIAEQYLSRIDALDQRGPAVNAVIELNPDALAIAATGPSARSAANTRAKVSCLTSSIACGDCTRERSFSWTSSLK